MAKNNSASERRQKVEKKSNKKKQKYFGENTIGGIPIKAQKFSTRTLAVSSVICIVILLFILAWAIKSSNEFLTVFTMFGIILLVLAWSRYRLPPKFIRAQFSQEMLWIAGETLKLMRDVQGELTFDNFHTICERILPQTEALAIAVTNETNILAFVGKYEKDFPIGAEIRTAPTVRCLKTGEVQSFSFSSTLNVDLPSWQENGRFSSPYSLCGIVAPLRIEDRTVGTIKFYYSHYHDIDPAQYSIITGFADLLSTQLTALELKKQVQLRGEAELRALQAQVNPHFLFNALNAIISFIRIEPEKARELLRQFSDYFRASLDNSDDHIPIKAEIEQTERYLLLEKARFGEGAFIFNLELPEELQNQEIRPFLLQPLVENAVQHARVPGKPLHIDLIVKRDGNNLILVVKDDGAGMSEETLKSLNQPEGTRSTHNVDVFNSPLPQESQKKHTRRALNNIRRRVAFHSDRSSMEISSAPSEGCTITICLADYF